jgi:CMP-N-acetylneuraminic acid synthetase
MSITAIIPARYGSKGVKRKNIRKINGCTLIKLAADIAERCEYVKRTIISTDIPLSLLDINTDTHEKVVIHRRPSTYATDSANIVDALADIVRTNEVTEDLMLLEPSSPTRTRADIDRAIRLYYRKHRRTVASVTSIDLPLAWVETITEDGWLVTPFRYAAEGVPRQNLTSKVYARDGLVYIFKRELLDNPDDDPTIYTEEVVPFTANHPVINIDTEEDMKKAREYMEGLRCK